MAGMPVDTGLTVSLIVGRDWVVAVELATEFVAVRRRWSLLVRWLIRVSLELVV